MPLQVTPEHCKQSIDRVGIQTSSTKILTAWVSVRPSLAPQQFTTLTDDKQIISDTCISQQICTFECGLRTRLIAVNNFTVQPTIRRPQAWTVPQVPLIGHGTQYTNAHHTIRTSYTLQYNVYRKPYVSFRRQTVNEK